MISAQFYQTFYLLVVLILTYYTINKYSVGSVGVEITMSSKKTTIILGFVVALFLGFRPLSYIFVDMVGYNYSYTLYLGQPFVFSWDTDNFLFDNLLLYFASERIDITYFFLLISLIYVGGIVLASIKMFPNDSLLAFVVYLGAFSTFSFGTNGIKAGAAASLFLVALSFKENLKVSIPLLWVCLGFHHSMLAPIVAFVLAFFIKRTNWFFYGWMFCLILAATHITFFMNLFAGFTDEKGAEYLLTDTIDKVSNVSGFRPDFILYSAVPVIGGYYLISKEYIQSSFYNFLWCTYTATNCVFLLCTYGTFINRIAYLSWLMFPFVLLYPVVNASWENKDQQFLYFKRVVWWHLYFTLFMLLIYYGYLRG